MFFRCGPAEFLEMTEAQLGRVYDQVIEILDERRQENDG